MSSIRIQGVRRDIRMDQVLAELICTMALNLGKPCLSAAPVPSEQMLTTQYLNQRGLPFNFHSILAATAVVQSTPVAVLPSRAPDCIQVSPTSLRRLFSPAFKHCERFKLTIHISDESVSPLR
jgi:hypothetical protein